jgi:hypothetical protein
MAHSKNRQEARLQELITRANALNLQVRKEKLLREAGYRSIAGAAASTAAMSLLSTATLRSATRLNFSPMSWLNRATHQWWLVR